MELFNLNSKDISLYIIRNFLAVVDIIRLSETGKTTHDLIYNNLDAINDPEGFINLDVIRKFKNIKRINVNIEISTLFGLTDTLLYLISSKVTSVRMFITEMDIDSRLYNSSIKKGQRNSSDNSFPFIIASILFSFLKIRKFDFVLLHSREEYFDFHKDIIFGLFDDVFYLDNIDTRAIDFVDIFYEMIEKLSLRYIVPRVGFLDLYGFLPQYVAEIREKDASYRTTNIAESLEYYISKYI